MSLSYGKLRKIVEERRERAKIRDIGQRVRELFARFKEGGTLSKSEDPLEVALSGLGPLEEKLKSSNYRNDGVEAWDVIQKPQPPLENIKGVDLIAGERMLNEGFARARSLLNPFQALTEEPTVVGRVIIFVARAFEASSQYIKKTVVGLTLCRFARIFSVRLHFSK